MNSVLKIMMSVNTGNTDQEYTP